MSNIDKIYSFRSYYEAIGFVAQEAEDRHRGVMDKLHVIEAALKAIFSAQPTAREMRSP